MDGRSQLWFIAKSVSLAVEAVTNSLMKVAPHYIKLFRILPAFPQVFSSSKFRKLPLPLCNGHHSSYKVSLSCVLYNSGYCPSIYELTYLLAFFTSKR